MVEPRVRAAMANVSGFSLADAIQRIAGGEWQLWLVYSKTLGCEAVVIGEFCQFPQRLEYHIRVCIGDNPQRWVHLRAIIEACAKRHGCTAIKMLAGRDGWIKLLPDYEATHVLLEKVL